MRKFYAFLLPVLFLSLVTVTRAQVSLYTFSQANVVYTPISGGTVLGSTTSDDQRFVDPAVPLGGTVNTGPGFPIGFNFVYNGIPFDRFGVGNNGWISLGKSSLTPSVDMNSTSNLSSFLSSTAVNTPADLRSRICGIGRDLQSQAGGEIRFETIGAAPNRKLVVQFTNYRRFAAAGESINFQIVLNETSNVVDVIFGTCIFSAASTAQSGLGGSVATDFNSRTTTTDWTATTASAVNTATLSFSAAIFPPSGLNYKWTPPSGCSGTPTAGTITGPSNACNGTPVTLTLTGYTNIVGIALQWKQSATSGGPYTDIPGANSSTYSFTATPGVTYYSVTVTCGSSGQSASAPEKSFGVINLNNLVATVTTACTPGAVLVTGTAEGGSPGNYTHTLTGPGTIVANPPSGANNSTGSFSVSNLPAGLHTFTYTTTSASGCVTTKDVTALVKQTPVITLTPATATICNGTVQPISASVVPQALQAFTQASTIVLPAGSPGTTSGNGSVYPSQITVSGIPTNNVSVKLVKLGNISHTKPDDMDVVLVSPTGQAVVLMSDAGGVNTLSGTDYTFDDGAPSLMGDNTLNVSGFYKPTNYETTDNFPAPGPGTLTQATPTLATFTGNMNGTWSLYAVDDATGDFGFIGNWSITFTITSLPTFSPTTNLFTDPAATVAYTGTPANIVYSLPAATTTYTAIASVDGCASTASSTINVNQVTAITAQPSPAAQTVCPGTTVVYSVAANGSALTYQWRLGTTNLANGGQISGATSNTLIITNVAAANAGSYTCVVTGACGTLTSTAAVLTVASAPTISTQPASVTLCAGGNTSFTVTGAGTPAPTLFQWQVSTDAGVTWTNIAGATSATLSLTAVTTTLNNNRYRVILTNTCGQTVTSNGSATLTVNALPTVTASALPAKICLNDTLVALTGSPVGGNWSGIGVQGFNFIPASTAVGTYTLTYTYTNTLGCTASAPLVAVVSDCPERQRRLSQDALVLFPNPSNGRFNIRMNSSLYNYLGMKVYNSMGQLVNGATVNEVLTSPVYTGLVYGRVIPIDLTYLPNGIYMVHFYYDNGGRFNEKAFKVIISR